VDSTGLPRQNVPGYGYRGVNVAEDHCGAGRYNPRQMLGFVLRIGIAASVIAVTLVAPSAARTEGIAPGLWRIVSRTETGGVIGPPHESSRCLSAREANDLAATFSPTIGGDRSSCVPVVRNLDGRKLTWRLVCRGRINMEESAEFDFDSRRHYTADLRKRAAVAGTPMINSHDMIEAQWVSAACRSSYRSETSASLRSSPTALIRWRRAGSAEVPRNYSAP
jgi:hypothetical protein